MKWTNDKIELLRRHYAEGHIASLAFRLGTSISALRRKARELNLSRSGYTRPKEWKQEHIDYITTHYADTPMDEMVRVTGRTTKSITDKAYALGLRRSTAYISDTTSKRQRELSHNAGWYTHGHRPHNKGVPLKDYVSPEAMERIKRAQWRVGANPDNNRPIGSERTSRDGYVYVKTPRGWVLKHHVVWEDKNSTIPAGCIIQFIDGNKMNYDISNLRCVTRSEAARSTFSNPTEEEKRRISERTKAMWRRRKMRIMAGLDPAV